MQPKPLNKDIVEKTGYDKSNVSRYLNGKQEPSEAFLRKFCDVYGIDYTITFGNDVDFDTSYWSLGNYYYPDVNAAAGLNFLTDNNNVDGRARILLPNVNVDAYIHVFGDSMYPKYCSGEIIGIKEVAKDLLQYGHAYAVEMTDGELYLKYIKPGSAADSWVLANENPGYPEREFKLSQISRAFMIKVVITKESMI